MKLVLILLLSFFTSSIFSQNIVVDDTKSAQELVETLFNHSGCGTISNFSVSGLRSYAYFNGNGSTFPFAEGIVLSTGTANHTVGPNTTLSDDNLGSNLDSDLAAIFSDTYDATVLEFDFVPASNYMSFEYIFASEEYQEGDNSTCQYSDVFAFLIKAVGDPDYKNIALIPNTTTPVQVTTVHPEIIGGCPAENESYFGSWNDSTAPINFNGQTAVLKAESTVVVGQTYHIKLVIADHQNYRYDSAVFLNAGSFNIGIDLGLDILRSTGNALCGTETVTLDSGKPGASSYTWTKDALPYDGVFLPLTGGNNQTYTVLSEGKYKVVVDLGNGCLSEGEIIVEYGTSPTVFNTVLEACGDGSNFAEFDLTSSNKDITGGDNSLIVENYYANISDASTHPNTTALPQFGSFTNQTVIARIKNTDGCVSFAEIELKISQSPRIADDESFLYCLNTYPDVITLQSGILNNNPTDFMYKWFFDNETDPIADLNKTTPTIDINETGNYIVEITNNLGNCMVSRTITVKPSNAATITNILVSDTNFSMRTSIVIEVSGEGDYEYAVDDSEFQDSNVFGNLLYGHHIITVRDKNGCLPNAQEEITILGYTSFFTPNNDGHHDTWNINNPNSSIHFNTVSDITILDRHGKIMAIIDANGQGWDGTYNGNPAPETDYWFYVDLINYKGEYITKRGHFSLKRT